MKRAISDFDSDWFGFRVGRADDPASEEWALENEIDCLCYLLPAGDQQTIHWAEMLGARMMDVRVELARDTNRAMSLARPFMPNDVDFLAGIAYTAFRGLTRFYADPRFADSRCDELYENWLRESCDGWADEVLVVDVDDEPAGFVTIHVEEADEEAAIGLIAVTERGRGKGMGSSLSRAAVDWAHAEGIPRISVVTQGCNIPAQRAFQSAGFVARKTDVWLHKWYE